MRNRNRNMEAEVMPRLYGILLLAVLVVVCLNASADDTRRVSEPPRKVESFTSSESALEYYIDRQLAEKMRVPVDALMQNFGEEHLLGQLEEIVNSPEQERSKAAMDILADAARKSEDLEFRQRFVKKVLMTNRRHSSRESEWLSPLKRADFSEESRKLLLDRLTQSLTQESGDFTDDLVVLWVGKAGVREAIPQLREVDKIQRLKKENLVSPLRDRSALLALARLGDKAAVAEAIMAIDRMQDQEDRAVHLGDLSYIHQLEVVDYLKRFLFSDIVFESRSRDVVPVSESWYASGALGSMLKGYPREETIEDQRLWMNGRTVYEFDS